MYTHRKFEEFIQVNRWYYDPERGISINTKNPQRAKDKKTLPMEQLELDGVAVGGRVVNTDGSSMKSSRLLLKQQAAAAAAASAAAAAAVMKRAHTKDDNKSDAANESDVASSEDEDSDCAIIVPRPAAAKKKKGDAKKPAATTAHANFEWTMRLRNSLITSINKHQGKAHNKGIAWDEVEHDMALPKNDLKAEWRRIQKLRKQQGEDEAKAHAAATGKDNGAYGNSDHDKYMDTVDNGTEATMKAFQEEMRREMREQQEEIRSLRTQTEERGKAISKLEGVVQQQNQREAAKELEHKAAIATLTSELANKNNELPPHFNDHFDYSSSGEVSSVSSEREKKPRLKKQKKNRRRKRVKSSEEEGIVMSEQELRNYGSALATIDENAALKKEIFLLNKVRK